MRTSDHERLTKSPVAAPTTFGRSSDVSELGSPSRHRRALGPSADELLSLVGDGVISTDEKGAIILFNDAAEAMFGYSADEVLGQGVEMLLPTRHRASHRVDVLRFGASASNARRSMGHRREVMGLRKSGEEFPVEASLSRRTIRGQRVLTVAVRDISERRRIEEERRLLTAELSHRFKNFLAVVNSIVSLSARDADTVESFREALLARLKAIASTQDMLFDQREAGLELRHLLEAELRPYARRDQLTMELSGPLVIVPAQSVMRLTLAVHELATNAAKYGALNKAGGSLTISWRTQEESGGPTLVLDWQETGGPPVRPSERRGFGSELIERCLGRANVHAAYVAKGLKVRIKLPLQAQPAEPDSAAAELASGSKRTAR